MEDKKERGIVVDTQTGEQIGVVYEGDRIVRGKSVAFLKEKKAVKTKNQFIKLFLDSAYALSLSSGLGIETRVCLRLMSCVRYGTGVIATDTGQSMSAGDIKKLCGDMSSRAVERALKKMVDANVLHKRVNGNRSVFYANPNVLMRGMKVDDELKQMFKGHEKIQPIKPNEKGDSDEKDEKRRSAEM